MYHDFHSHCATARTFKIHEIADNLKDNKMWVNATDVYGDTPCHIASRNRQISFVGSMLPYFTRVNSRNGNGDTVLHVFVDRCVRVRRADNAIRAFISKSSYLRKRFDKKYRIIRGLLAKGADVNLTNDKGITPAQLAAKHGYIDVLKIFKSAKRHIDVNTRDGENMLHLVCKNTTSSWRDTPAEIEIILYLMRQGCDLNAANREGYSALHYAVESREVDTVRRLIRLAFADEESKLHEAARIGDASVLGFLIDEGCDVHARDEFERTPLHLATTRKFQRRQAMRKLLESNACVDARDVDGRSPLDYILANEDVEGLKCLMDFGIDVKVSTGWLSRGEALADLALRHATIMQTAGFEVSEIYEWYLGRKHLQALKSVCSREVEEMKETEVYEILHAEPRRCRVGLRTTDLAIRFPSYHCILRVKTREIDKWRLIKPAVDAWYRVVGVHLPHVCVEKILGNLRYCCLRNLIDTADAS